MVRMIRRDCGAGLVIYEVHWQSDASGNASEWLDMRGLFDHAVTVPSGTAAPTANYDITLLDKTGIDVLGGLLANRHTANVEVVDLYRASAASDRHQEVIVRCPTNFTVANAGNAMRGLCAFHVLTR